MDLEGNLLRFKWNKVALNSVLAGKLLTHDFGVAIVFTSVNSSIPLMLGRKILHPYFLAYQRVLGEMYGTTVHTSLKL